MTAAPPKTATSRGRFITFEGIDGSGKSTQLRLLAEELMQAGYSVVETREPGGTLLGNSLRTLLLESGRDHLSPQAELALLFAARAQHIAEVIEPGLARGAFVLCDRFTDATDAYQGAGRALGSDLVWQLHHLLCGVLMPELTLILDIDPEIAVSRARDRLHRARSREDRFEREPREFFQRVRAAYRERARLEPRRCVLLDAAREIAAVQKDIRDVIQRRLAVSFSGA